MNLSKVFVFLFFVILLSSVASSYTSFNQNIKINYITNNDTIILFTGEDTEKIKFEPNKIGNIDLDTDIKLDYASCPAISSDTAVKVLLDTYTSEVKNKIVENCNKDTIDETKLSNIVGSKLEVCNDLFTKNSQLNTDNAKLKSDCDKVDIIQDSLKEEIKSKNDKNTIIVFLFVLVFILIATIIGLLIMMRKN